MVDGRASKKSRAGCLTCKLRKVKCDETRPTCGNCNRYFQHAGACQWAPREISVEKSSRPDGRHFEAYQHSRAQSNLSPNLRLHGHIVGTISTEENQLFHHFTAITCRTLPLCPEPAALNLWTYAIPQIASEHGYLRSAMIATAALHYYHLKPDDESMLNRASHFYGRSLRALSRDLAEPSRTNAEPLVMASLLISMLSSQFTRTFSKSLNFTPAIDYFRVAKGNAALLRATAKWTKDSALKGYLESRSTYSTSIGPRSPSHDANRSLAIEAPKETPTEPNRNLLFIQQNGPALDHKAVRTVRSRVMVEYRRSKRKLVSQLPSRGSSNRIAPLEPEQQDPRLSSSNITVSQDLLQTIAPPSSPTFSYLLHGISPTHPSHDTFTAYLAHLESTLEAMHAGEPLHLLRIRSSTMPGKTPPEFVELVEGRDERALVMMMHHYALLKLVDDVWWMRGIAKYNFDGLRGMVSRDWDWALEGPMKVMKWINEGEKMMAIE